MNRQHPYRCLNLLLITASLSLPVAVGAAEEENDRFNLSLGSFMVQRTDATVRIDRAAGPLNIGTAVSWERDLGGETSMVVPRFDGYFRLAPKHRIDLSWFKIDREGSKVLDRQVDIGDHTFNIGTTVKSELMTETTKLAYTYSFFRSPEIETALSLGMHITRLETAIESTNQGRRASQAVTAPLPVFGFRIAYAVTPDWWVKSNYDLFFLDEIDNVRSGMSDFTLAVEYRVSKHLGLGLGMNRYQFSVEGFDDEFRGKVDSVLNGYLFYLSVR